MPPAPPRVPPPPPPGRPPAGVAPEPGPEPNPAPSSWWWRRRWVLVACSAVAVGGLVVGLVVWRQTSAPAAPDRRPFYAAVNQLAATPALHYRSSTSGSPVGFDVRLTGDGESIGSISLAGQKFGLLTVGGTSYVKAPDGLLPDTSGGGSPGAAASALKGRWITGGDTTALDSTTSQITSPGELANRLLTALNAKDAVIPSAHDAGTTADGVPALKAVTSLGDVYITKKPPYRVLRIAPDASSTSGRPTLPSLPPIPTLPSGLPSLPSGLPSLPSGLPSLPSLSGLSPSPAGFVALAPSALGTIDFPQLTEDDFKQLFQELETDTRQLSKAVDSSIRFNLQGSAHLKCGAGGCLVTATVSSDVSSSDPKATISGGKAEATLNATVEIEGAPAGGCTATAQLPLNGTSEITCDDASAGAVFSAQEAEKKAIAEEESEAEDGEPVPYTVSSTGEASVEAIAQVDVRELVQEQQAEYWYARYPGPLTYDDPYGPYILTEPDPSASPTVPAPPDDDFDDPRRCAESKPAGADTVGAQGWILNTTGASGRTETGTACLIAPVKGHETDAKGDIVGLREAQRMATAHGLQPAEVVRCHIIPARFYGSNTKMSNLSPCWQRPVNVGVHGMSGFESLVGADIAQSPPGTIVLYTVEPTFNPGAGTIPNGYQMAAIGSTPDGTEVWQQRSKVPNEKNVGDKSVNLGN
jgi:hypothetical protein